MIKRLIAVILCTCAIVTALTSCKFIGLSGDGVNDNTDKKEIPLKQALDIAKEYWKDHLKEENGYRVFEGTNKSAPETVYVFLLRHLVEIEDSSHYSTVDEIWVDRTTGEAIVPTYKDILDTLYHMTFLYNLYKLGEAEREDYEYLYDLSTDEKREMYEKLDELVSTWYPPALGASSPAKNAFAYAIKDLNGDGTKELVLITSERYHAFAVLTEKDGRIIFDDSFSFNVPSDGISHRLDYWINTVGLDLKPLFPESTAFDLDYLSKETIYSINCSLQGLEFYDVWLPQEKRFLPLMDYEVNTPLGKKPLSEIEDKKFAFVDMDGDTIDELIIDCGELLMMSYRSVFVHLNPITEEELQRALKENSGTAVEFLPLDKLWGDALSPLEAIDVGKEYWEIFLNEEDVGVELRFRSHFYTKMLSNAPDTVYILQLVKYDSHHNSEYIEEIWVDKLTGEIKPPYSAEE